mmetsp:Transcript_6873/g.15014  ORF Transcript_6873/g.15014 Transcript_6873/m.15014 type:complete len:349 (+) Transcript_6873:150-1196(+)
MKSSLRTILPSVIAISSCPRLTLAATNEGSFRRRTYFTNTAFISRHQFLSKTNSFPTLSPRTTLLAAQESRTASTSPTLFNPREPTIPILTSMPEPLPPLRNYYYLLRHGQSTANVEGIISSARSLAGSSEHGLTPLGQEQGTKSAGSLVDLIADDLLLENGDGASFGSIGKSTKKVYFYSSPFARAEETALKCLEGMRETGEVVKKIEELGLDVQDDVILVDGLMERFFGRLDGKELATYAYVWPVDMFMPTHTAFDVESVAAVSTRIRSTLLDIDSRYPEGGNHIVLTSHADVLQITQCYAAGLENVGMFSQYRFGNGEVRKMGRDVGSLPEPVPLQPPKRGEFAA